MIKAAAGITLFMLILLAACSQGYIVNMDEITHFPEGRNLFISKCNGCHQLYSPYDYTEAVWDSVLLPMQSKAKLDDKQRNEIYNWIIEMKNNNFQTAEQN